VLCVPRNCRCACTTSQRLYARYAALCVWGAYPHTFGRIPPHIRAHTPTHSGAYPHTFWRIPPHIMAVLRDSMAHTPTHLAVFRDILSLTCGRIPPVMTPFTRILSPHTPSDYAGDPRVLSAVLETIASNTKFFPIYTINWKKQSSRLPALSPAGAPAWPHTPRSVGAYPQT